MSATYYIDCNNEMNSLWVFNSTFYHGIIVCNNLPCSSSVIFTGTSLQFIFLFLFVANPFQLPPIYVKHRRLAAKFVDPSGLQMYAKTASSHQWIRLIPCLLYGVIACILFWRLFVVRLFIQPSTVRELKQTC